MAIEATPIEPQEVTHSPRHQNLADQVEQGFVGLWNWVERYLPVHDTHKPNTLNNLKQGYDNAIAAIKADAEATLKKLEGEGAAALTTAEEGAQSAVQDAAGAVVKAQQGSAPTSSAATSADNPDGVPPTS